MNSTQAAQVKAHQQKAEGKGVCMREEFEKVFPVDKDIYFSEGEGWYRSKDGAMASRGASGILNNRFVGWQAATALQAERVRELEEALAELQRKYDAENEPDCYSEDGDYWFDCPNDIELVEGKKVGDRFCLLGGFHALPIQFRVTKAPDDESDDYEVEQALSATAREVGDE